MTRLPTDSRRSEEHPGPETPDVHRSQLPRVIRGFSWLAASQLLVQLIGLGVLAIVTRRIGEANFGACQFAIALVAYFCLPMNFGFEGTATREVAQSPAATRDVARDVLGLQLFVAILAYGALVLLADPLGANAVASQLIPLAGLTIVLLAAWPEWVLLARGNIRDVAIARISGQLVYGVAAPFVITSGFAGAQQYVLLIAVGTFVSVIVATWFAWRRFGRIWPRLSPTRAWQRVRRSTALGISLAATAAYSRIDIVILGFLGTASQVGFYAAAYRLPLALISFVSMWLAAFFPYLSEISLEQPDHAAREVGRACTIAAVVGVPLVLFSIALAEPLMETFFGTDFGDAAVPFVILAASSVLIIASANLIYALVALGDERRFAVIATIGLLINVLVCALLIPSLGANGAAVATFVTEGFVLLYCFMRMRRLSGPMGIDSRRVGRAVVACVPAAVTLVALGFLPLLPLVLVSGCVYCLSAVILGVVTQEDLAFVIRP